MTQISSCSGFTRALAAMNLRSALALRGASVAQVVFMVLNNLTFFVFWWALMQHAPSIRGWRLADTQMLFGIVATAYGLAGMCAGGARYLGRFIDDGTLDTLSTQPRATLPYVLGLRMQPSDLGDLLSGVMLIALTGQLSWRGTPLLLLAILASAIVLVSTAIVFFSLAFWLGNVDTATRQVWELLLTFSLYPEPLFGGALRLALFTVLPAGFIG
jgi:ABC-2 type transport system permease protein